MSKWPVIKDALAPPPLGELVPVIQASLEQNFEVASTCIVECPNLSSPPFNLAGRGLCGNERIADVGGQPYLSPSPKLDKKYSLLDMADLMEMSKEQGFLLGAGAGPFYELGFNSELAPNLSWKGDSKITDRTRFIKVLDSGEAQCNKLDSSGFALMCNLFGSDGAPGPVLKVTAKSRTGSLNFPATIQAALRDQYKDHRISLGGVFLIKSGKAKMHVMPDFASQPLRTNEAKQEWLRYYDMSAPLVCLSVFHSHDPGLSLRMEHTHCFSEHGDGGHYHCDITPTTVEYEGYFQVAKALYRIDRPPS